MVKPDLMNDAPPVPEDFVTLYRRAFAEYGPRALWNMRAVEDPTPADALAIERMAGWKAAVWQNGYKTSAVPLTKLQSHAFRGRLAI
jgi:hypothetical protein